MTAVRLARGATGRGQDPEVRRLLPRARRRAARRRRERRRDARAPGLGRRDTGARSPTRSSCRTTTVPRSTPRSPSTAPSSPRCSSSRSPRTWVWSRRSTASSTHLRRAVHRARCAARVRRGDHRLPRRSRRRAGPVRDHPDLSIFGKVIGGGLPLAAVGGPAALMDELAPLGPVYQAGTLSGNPLATAAGLAVLARARRRLLRRARAHRGAPVRRSARRRSPMPVSTRSCPRLDDRRSVLRGRAGPRLRRREGVRRRRVRPLLPRDARPRGVPRAERVRVDVPEPRPHRCRHRPHDRPRREAVLASRYCS